MVLRQSLLWGLAISFALLWVSLVAGVTIAKDLNGKWAQASPLERRWFKEQKRPGTNFLCCNEADGEQVDEEIREGRYWINSTRTGGNWWIVPEESVLKTPNKHGRPVAWFRINDNGQNVIFCYAPGPLL